MLSEFFQLPLPLSLGHLLFAVLVVFLAYTVKGLSGFGSGLIAVPLLAFLFPLTVIVPVLGLLSYAGSIIQSISLRQQVVWRDLLPLIPFSLLGIATALWLLVNVDDELLSMSLGLFVSAYALYSLLPVKQISGGRPWSVLAGGLGGLVGALFGTGGPFYVIYLKLRQLDKGQFRATIAMIFLIDGGFRIVGYAGTGLYNPQVLLLSLILFPVLLLALYTGHHMHLKMPQSQFNKLVTIFLLVSGVLLVFKAL